MSYDTTTLSAAFADHAMELIPVATAADALTKIKELIPAGASVTNGSSVTLQSIGYIEYLKQGAHGWNNHQAAIVAETDMAKQAQLRKQLSVADFYLGSVHALTETGELVIATATGSQLPGIVYNASNLIFVVGKQKVVPSLDAAFKRIQETVIPLEDERMKKAYGFGTLLTKTVIFHREHPMSGRTVRVILVDEPLGY